MLFYSTGFWFLSMLDLSFFFVVVSLVVVVGGVERGRLYHQQSQSR